MAGTSGRGGLPPLDDATMLKLADLLMNSVPGRDGVLPQNGGIRVQSFRGEWGDLCGVKAGVTARGWVEGAGGGVRTVGRA